LVNVVWIYRHESGLKNVTGSDMPSPWSGPPGYETDHHKGEKTMTREQRKIINELRREGYAIVVMRPEDVSDHTYKDLKDYENVLEDYAWRMLGIG
jgi:hypothetical protein